MHSAIGQLRRSCYGTASVTVTTTTNDLRPFVQDYPGEPVPKETFTLSHQQVATCNKRGVDLNIFNPLQCKNPDDSSEDVWLRQRMWHFCDDYARLLIGNMSP